MKVLKEQVIEKYTNVDGDRCLRTTQLLLLEPSNLIQGIIYREYVNDIIVHEQIFKLIP